MSQGPQPPSPSNAALAELAETVIVSPSTQSAAAHICRRLAGWAPGCPAACILQGAAETALHACVPAPLRRSSLAAILNRFTAAGGRPVEPHHLLYDVEVDSGMSGSWTIARAIPQPIPVRGAVRGALFCQSTRRHPPASLSPLLERISLWLGPVLAGLERIHAEARWDSVTAMYNRRYLEESLAREYALAQRHRLPLSLLLADADDFKRINDQWGHPTGDRALREIGTAIRDAVRATDIVCRYGGDEFAVILPCTGPEGVPRSVDRIAEAVRRRRVHAGRRLLPLRISVGSATYDPRTEESAASLLQRADADLYRRKLAGR